MREIKFRGKRLENGKWIYGDLYHAGDITCICDWSIRPNTVENFAVDPATVGQYTGLQDMNGEDIWEDDIMCIPETDFNAEIVGRVLYEDGSYYIIPFNGGHLWGLYWSLRKHDAKLIGNIHDNPELLKTE